MKILVINAGSSSLKYQLIDMTNESVIAKGNCERIGIEGGKITHKKADGTQLVEQVNFANHTEAFEKLIWVLTESSAAVISNLCEISAVGHRVVQGAEIFSESVLVTDDVVNKIEEIADLAPLHNIAHAQAIRACQKVLGDKVPQVVVFDTSFHQTMPEKAYIFGIPYKYYKKYHIRRYGFHGTSHRYVSARVSKLMNKSIKNLKIVTCHLGNGSSISAVKYGQCIDTSMGFTPLGGMVMGTRCGDIDPSVICYLAEKENMGPKEMAEFLNRESGILGISELTSDDRDLRAGEVKGNHLCKLAADIQRYQVKKYIGAYAAAMGGIDVLVFTGGIGENSIVLRQEVCDDMEFLGIKVDDTKNVYENNGKEVDISAADARCRTWIIPTNEELTIAKDTKAILQKMK